MFKLMRNAYLIGALTLCGPAAAQVGSGGVFPSQAEQKPSGRPESAVGSGATSVKQIATRLSTFGIPITARENSERIKELQLHVSADRGKSWRLYYRVSPQDKFFPFKAAADGEYWFATRIVDSNSRSAPEGDLRPEMKVFIDTTPPRLMLTSELTPSGEVIANWQATDPLLSAKSLKLEYQTSPNGPWRSIAVPLANQQPLNGVLSGKVAWFPREAARGVIQLRAEILDQAGNHAVAVDRIGQGTLAQGKKELEPPVAGPASPPKQTTEKNAEKGPGAFSSVSKWFGGAFGGSSNRQTPPEDPFASSIPSDISDSIDASPSNVKETPSSSPSQWSASNTELTDSGIRRIPASQGSKPLESSSKPADEPVQSRTDKRGPGRLASAATVREPRRDSNSHEDDQTESANTQRPSIQPPENASRELPSSDKEANPEGAAALEMEEIPPPITKPRLVPADPARNEAEPSSSPVPTQEAEEALASPPTNRREAVESYSHEESRQPIPSAPRKKPGEFRVRTPIASGLKGDEKGVARPPSSSHYRKVAAERERMESTAASERLPAGAEPIYSNRQRFGLEYEVNLVGSSGVSEVELWATRDGGQSWSRWGSDPDRRSPFDVEVDGEGVFGFRIVVLSRGGLASRPPQPGDEADQWVVVDTTSPRLALRGAGYGSEERAGQLAISWDAEDSNLTEKSVSLYYSDREEGPWTRIVGDLANQGEYFWRVDSRIPPRIYIKVEVRDGAGNLASDQTRDAIKVEGLTPSGKIRRIIPRDDSNE